MHAGGGLSSSECPVTAAPGHVWSRQVPAPSQISQSRPGAPILWSALLLTCTCALPAALLTPLHPRAPSTPPEAWARCMAALCSGSRNPAPSTAAAAGGGESLGSCMQSLFLPPDLLDPGPCRFSGETSLHPTAPLSPRLLQLAGGVRSSARLRARSCSASRVSPQGAPSAVPTRPACQVSPAAPVGGERGPPGLCGASPALH